MEVGGERYSAQTQIKSWIEASRVCVKWTQTSLHAAVTHRYQLLARSDRVTYQVNRAAVLIHRGHASENLGQHLERTEQGVTTVQLQCSRTR